MVGRRIKKIGIALAAYEPNLTFFEEQLKSIQDQTFGNWICIVSFDSQMKRVLDEPAIKQFAHDKRFRFVENPFRLGHKKNFEKALNEVILGGVDAIACSDQDDIWYPEKLQTCVQYLSLCPPMSLVHSDMHVLVGDKKLSSTGWTLERRGVKNVKQHHLFVRNVIAGCATLMDAEIIRKFPIIPEEAPFHDHWYGLVSSTLGQVVPIYKPLYAYRQHSGNVLAVAPYRGLFSKTNSANPQRESEISIAVIRRFKISHQFVMGAQGFGLRLSRMSKILFLSNWDFGLGLGLLGAKKIVSDPALARACLARSAGKLLSLLQKRDKPPPQTKE